VRQILLWLALPALLSGQPDARALVRQSIQHGAASWKKSFDYSCIKEDIDRQFGSDGKVKSVDDDVYRMVPAGYNTSFELHIKHDGEPVPASDLKDQKAKLAALEAESPEQKRKRFEKLRSQRSYMAEVPEAFNFKIIGSEDLPTGPAWVIEATPRPGYIPKSRYAHFFASMRGKLWIDKKDLQWVKADAVAMDTVSFGFFIARLSKGSHIVLEQMRLPDDDWVAKSITARAHARLLFFFTKNFEEDITYRDYRWGGNAVTADRSR
jgi:hypothetical protein